MSKPEMQIDEFGTKCWYLNGELHREDGPAFEDTDGTEQWWVKGELHRIDGPAWIHPNGKKEWCVNGRSHRVDGPAIVWPDGSMAWYLDDEEVTWQQVFEQANNPEIELQILSYVMTDS